MEFYTSTQLSVPLFQMMSLLAVTTIALLFGRTKLALLINYIFALYWGYIFNRELIGFPENVTTFTFIYFGFGVSIVILASLGFLVRTD